MQMFDIFEDLNNQLNSWLSLTKNENPYVENLVEMGYDRADCETVATAGIDKKFPLNIHGRVYNTQEEYNEAIADFINGL